MSGRAGGIRRDRTVLGKVFTMRVCLLFLAFGLFGCPQDALTEISAKCVKLGDKCKLPSGPLGVCDQQPCPGKSTDDRSKMCLRCISQH